MRIGANLKKRQGGAVAVIVGIGLALIIGFLALVIDLGHLYLARTGQQNAADAAALSGAKELDGTSDGIDRAVEWAQKLTANGNDATVRRNRFLGNLGWEEVALPLGNIHFGAAPYTSDWKTVDQAKAQPGGLYFIKVDTETGAMGTWFAGIWNLFSISTYGSAVAGRFVNNIAPIGLCALRHEREKWVGYDSGGNQYLTEFGFTRGLSYDFLKINEAIGGLAPGTELYLHPTATSESCDPSMTSASFAAPFLCTGKSNIAGTAGSVVYTNTGLAAGMSVAAMNTRFGQYGPPLDSSLDSTACPPDLNIREFVPGGGAGGSDNWMSPVPQPRSAYLLEDWLAGPSGASSVQRTPLLSPASSVVNAGTNAGGCNGDCTDNYGVLWSYSQPARSTGSFTRTDWPALYPLGPVSNPAYTGTASPYQRGLSGHESTYYLEPTPADSAAPDRRVLNVVLVDCDATPPSGGNCRPLNVLGVGKFFLQRTATVSGWITGEFAGLLSESEMSPTIRLYR
ncbi:MAG TPA: pilus assembly protein TadG-related protein [Gallionella sp.]|nr:pilus assembly protein TadG-related protein [Gallionella sp.]